MPEPFKNVFSQALISQMGACFRAADTSFDETAFMHKAGKGLEALELKARSEQIKEAIACTMPQDFAQAAPILLESLAPMQTPDKVSEAPEHAHLLKSWAIMPMAEYAATYGADDFDKSFQVLLEMTQRFSSEFAIRHLILADPEKTLDALRQHLNSPSKHVRRLISEGTRPRLPWGMQLGMFVKDPKPLLPLLDALKDDPSEYVRRSVANNLNDIAKDHGDVVIEVCTQWMQGADSNRTKLIRHACRTLFKQGKPEALALFGFLAPKLRSADIQIEQSSVTLGQSVSLTASLCSNSAEPQDIMLDYVVYHQKANGSLSPKVFKWKQFKLNANEAVNVTKQHSFKVVTTRRYYSGEHRIALLINGKEYSQATLTLTM